MLYYNLCFISTYTVNLLLRRIEYSLKLPPCFFIGLVSLLSGISIL